VGDDAGFRDAVFFALKPSLDAAQQAKRLGRHLRNKFGLSGAPLMPRCFHVSLFGLGCYGELADETITAACEAAASVTMKRFLIAFDYVESFGGNLKYPVVLTGDEGVTGITMLRHELIAALRKIGLVGAREPHFAPHMTLLYDPRKVREQAVEEISWTASDFLLVRSLHGQSRHELLGRWPLRPSSSAP
jgi:RNA 2',3'-cyclic 3'-phosphodiesterase